MAEETIPSNQNPVWEQDKDKSDFWYLRGESVFNMLGEIYPQGGQFRWNHLASDWRGYADTIEAAKIELLERHEIYFKYISSLGVEKT